MPCTLEFEDAARAAGNAVIAGIDEAGRGPLAGPVMAAAVILPVDFEHPILNDSKKLTAKRRDTVYEDLCADDRLLIARCAVDVDEIETLNILKATHVAMARAAAALGQQPDLALIDGLPVPGFPLPQQAIVGGDGKSLSIAAASIIAKVERDRIMIAYAEEFPEYGFEAHKGYGTKKHMAALQKHGPCPIHRKTFQPIAELAVQFGQAKR